MAAPIYTIWCNSISQYGDATLRSGWHQISGPFYTESEARAALTKLTRADGRNEPKPGDYELRRGETRVASVCLAGALPKRKPAAARSES